MGCIAASLHAVNPAAKGPTDVPTPAEEARAAEEKAAVEAAAVEKQKAAEDAVQETVDVKEAKAKDSEDRFPKEELVGRMRQALDYPAHVIAGALHSVDQDELTLKEANAACKTWLGQEV